MKIRNPKSRMDLSITKGMHVLEVGGGHNPHPKANIVVDKFVDDNSHRSGNISVLKNQTFIEADGESLPFKDKEFDYVICCQVLEHVDNPTQFLKEQFRVAKRGYIETPSLIGECLFPRDSHKWILHEYLDKLYLINKENIGFQYSYDIGELIQDYLPKSSIGFKILERTHPNLFTIRIEWDSNFEYEVDSNDPEILKFFTNKWKLEWGNDFFPKKTLGKELRDATAAFISIIKAIVKSRILDKFKHGNP